MRLVKAVEQSSRGRHLLIDGGIGPELGVRVVSSEAALDIVMTTD
jgi:hypothetical protein